MEAYTRGQYRPNDMWDLWSSTNGPIGRVLERVPEIARGREPVLIIGEKSSGRGALARLINHHSPRAEQPVRMAHVAMLQAMGVGLFDPYWVTLDDDTRILSGHFERASGGTLVLEYIHDLRPGDQGRLLRTIVTGRSSVVSAPNETPVDVRLITSTHVGPLGELPANQFDRYLCARLSATTIYMPPLRERVDELGALAAFFLRHRGNSSRRVEDAAIALLADYWWPKNIIELEQVVWNLPWESDGLTRDTLRALAHRCRNTSSEWPLVPYLLDRL